MGVGITESKDHEPNFPIPSRTGEILLIFFFLFLQMRHFRPRYSYISMIYQDPTQSVGMRTERTPAVYLLDCILLIVTHDLVHFPAQWHHQIPPPMTVRPSGSRYGSLTSKGLDIFSAFSSMESTMVYSCSSRSVVESDEL